MDRRLTTRQTGLLLATTTALISGFAVFLNGYGVRAWAEVADATTYTTLKNALAALLIGLAATGFALKGSPDRPRRPTSRRQRFGLGLIAVIGGSVPFVLFFEGLARASSAQAAFIHKTLVVWVAILAMVLLKERIGFPHLGAIGLLLVGQVVLVGGFGDLVLGTGELMILAATLLWAVEVVMAKRLLAQVSSSTVAIARMVGGSVLLIGYVLLRGVAIDWALVTGAHAASMLGAAVFLSGYVLTWFAALSRAPAVDVTAVLVGGAVITALLQTSIRGAALPDPVGLALIALGVAATVLVSWRRPAIGRGT